MPLIVYEEKQFRKSSLDIVAQANSIIDEYRADGYDLTLRQLYYQFVARDLIPNKDSEYSRLGSIINNARLAGLIDWNAIVDRTRFTRSNSHWDSPVDIIEACASQFRLDTRSTQENYIEVWVEKDALIGVVEGVCSELDITCFSCRGFVSQSAMWRAANKRFIKIEQAGQDVTILHLGDHDPSGIDMTRDIQERLRLFGSNAGVKRIALNMDQVEQYNPPPNPAKLTDSRCRAYIEEYGSESWELDALDPRTIAALIRDEVDKRTDNEARRILIEQEQSDRNELGYIANNWVKIVQRHKR